MKELTFTEFMESINKFTLRFKDPKLESKYLAERTNVLKSNKIFLILLISLLALLILRDIEEFVFMFAKEETIYISKPVLVARFVAIVVAFVFEIVVLYFERLSNLKGFSSLISALIFNIVSSYSFDSSGIGFIPTYFHQ